MKPTRAESTSSRGSSPLIEDFRKDLPDNALPALILHGDADRILPPDATSRRQAKLLPNAQLVELPGGRTECSGRMRSR